MRRECGCGGEAWEDKGEKDSGGVLMMKKESNDSCNQMITFSAENSEAERDKEKKNL